MINSRVLSETYAVVMASGQEYIDLIPEEILDYINKKRDASYTPAIDENKPLDQQGFDKGTIAMIAMLKLNYWCKTEEEKAKLLAHLETNEEKLKEKLGSSKSARELLKMFRNN